MKKLFKKVESFSLEKCKSLDKYCLYLVDYLKNNLSSSNANGFLLSVSGGLDSSFLALFLEKHFPNQVHFLFQPAKITSSLTIQSINEIKVLLKNDDKFLSINLENTKSQVVSELNLQKINISQKAESNIFPRIRMINSYAIANQLNLLVVGTSNRCEWELGYFTKWGDGASDVYPIIHLTKSEILYLSKKYKVPQIILERTPSAELFENQSDEKEIGLGYDIIEKYLEKKRLEPSIIKKIEKIIYQNFHKKFLNFPKSIDKIK